MPCSKCLPSPLFRGSPVQLNLVFGLHGTTTTLTKTDAWSFCQQPNLLGRRAMPQTQNVVSYTFSTVPQQGLSTTMELQPPGARRVLKTWERKSGPEVHHCMCCTRWHHHQLPRKVLDSQEKGRVQFLELQHITFMKPQSFSLASCIPQVIFIGLDTSPRLLVPP
jgi:hypothetical protein